MLIFFKIIVSLIVCIVFILFVYSKRPNDNIKGARKIIYEPKDGVDKGKVYDFLYKLLEKVRNTNSKFTWNPPFYDPKYPGDKFNSSSVSDKKLIIENSHLFKRLLSNFNWPNPETIYSNDKETVFKLSPTNNDNKLEVKCITNTEPHCKSNKHVVLYHSHIICSPDYGDLFLSFLSEGARWDKVDLNNMGGQGLYLGPSKTVSMHHNKYYNVVYEFNLYYDKFILLWYCYVPDILLRYLTNKYDEKCFNAAPLQMNYFIYETIRYVKNKNRRFNNQKQVGPDPNNKYHIVDIDDCPDIMYPPGINAGIIQAYKNSIIEGVTRIEKFKLENYNFQDHYPVYNEYLNTPLGANTLNKRYPRVKFSLTNSEEYISYENEYRIIKISDGYLEKDAYGNEHYVNIPVYEAELTKKASEQREEFLKNRNQPPYEVVVKDFKSLEPIGLQLTI